jgi:hypothetical protein
MGRHPVPSSVQGRWVMLQRRDDDWQMSWLHSLSMTQVQKPRASPSDL